MAIEYSVDLRFCLFHFGKQVRVKWKEHSDFGKTGVIVGIRILTGPLPLTFEYITVRLDSGEEILLRPKHVDLID